MRTSFVAIVCLAACGSPRPSPSRGSPQTGPQPPAILSLAANHTSLTAAQAVTITALLSGEVAGGMLSDGASLIGHFSSSGDGTWALSLSWDDLQAARAITFTDHEDRALTAEFFDSAGDRTSGTLTLRLTCGANSACDGACVDLSSDVSNCGGCGVTCDAGSQWECGGGECIHYEDVDGPVDCNAGCAQFGKQCTNQCRSGSHVYASMTTYASSDGALSQQVWGTSCTDVPAAKVSSSFTLDYALEACCCK